GGSDDGVRNLAGPVRNRVGEINERRRGAQMRMLARQRQSGTLDRRLDEKLLTFEAEVAVLLAIELGDLGLCELTVLARALGEFIRHAAAVVAEAENAVHRTIRRRQQPDESGCAVVRRH